MTVYKVDGWDLNFWFSEDTQGWRVGAYPYDETGEWIGEHMMWLDLDVTNAEVEELRLGAIDNLYVPDEDFWADARWMISDYPHLSASFMPKIMSLPKRVKIVNNELMKVEE
jgi:hypothetical protein